MTDTDQTNSGDESSPNSDQERNAQLALEAEKEERAVLMNRARMMGLTISNNIGIEKLRERIANAIEGKADTPEVTPPALMVDPREIVGKKQNFREKMRREQLKLIRCHIVNLDPKKKDLHGEIFTTGNRVLGTVRKFVPYGEVTENGYHLPYIIYKMLKAKKFLNIRTRRGPKGEPLVETNWAQEFAITVLPPLTKAELHDLAVAQAAAGSVGS
jgi:hypothetical protein